MRYAELAPHERGFSAFVVSDQHDDVYSDRHEYWDANTDQIIVTRNKLLLAAEPLRHVARPLVPRPDLRVWTDDFYNLLRVLK